MKQTTVRIDGMIFVADVAGIEKRIKRHGGVSRVDASYLSITPSNSMPCAHVCEDALQRA